MNVRVSAIRVDVNKGPTGSDKTQSLREVLVSVVHAMSVSRRRAISSASINMRRVIK
jgi:hypothetical protein